MEQVSIDTLSLILNFRMTEKQRAKLEAEAKKKLSDMRKNAAAEMKLREEKLERLRVRFHFGPLGRFKCSTFRR